ncbi:MAG: HEAT repeat domain-containing protein [Aquificaceae bacterium]|nr:HEAT repeat domain-containing protein [Aquificaceae bacterium]
MQGLLLAEYSLKLKPIYGPFHRDMLNFSWLIEAIRSSLRSGYFMFQSVEGFEFLPVLEGKVEGEIPNDFELVSFFATLENFVINAFGLYEKHWLPLYSEKPLWINLESINFNLREFFRKLADFEVTGFMLVDNRVRLTRGYLILQKGAVVRVQYGGEVGESGLKRFLEEMGRDVCTIRVYELGEELVAFLLMNYELVGSYRNYEAIPLDKVDGTAMVVSVSPERYGYAVFFQGQEMFREGFDEEAPFYELMVSTDPSATAEPIDPLIFLQEDQHIRMVKHDPEHPILYFCPACWSVVSKDDRICPNCGYDLTEFHHLPYEYKLIMALEHPVKEMKKNVIYTVGRKDLEVAIPHLEIMIARETDPLVLMEVADALSRMSSPEATRLLRMLAQHQYPVVRSRANLHLRKRLRDVIE